MLDERGFKRPKYSELVAEAENQAREKWGENVNTQPLSPLGIIIRIHAFFMNLLWQDAEDIYNSAFRDTATGVSLYRLGSLTGNYPNQAQYARGEIHIVGTPGYQIPEGLIVRTAANVLYYTEEDVTLDSGGSAYVTISAQEPGLSGNAAAGTVNDLLTTDTNITTVTNHGAVTGGREKETDTEFRSRLGRSNASAGGGTSDSILSAVLGVAGVRAATVVNNRTLTTDSDGRPGKSFQTYVLGGTEQEIAEAIFSKQPAGIESFGDIEKTVTDMSGQIQEVNFSRSQEVQIALTVDVTRNTSYPADGDSQIEAALVNYVGGEYAGGFYNGLSMGEDVIYAKLISAALSVPGVVDVTITAGVSGGAQASANVAIQPFQVAQTSEALIGVTSHV